MISYNDKLIALILEKKTLTVKPKNSCKKFSKTLDLFRKKCIIEA